MYINNVFYKLWKHLESYLLEIFNWSVVSIFLEEIIETKIISTIECHNLSFQIYSLKCKLNIFSSITLAKYYFGFTRVECIFKFLCNEYTWANAKTNVSRKYKYNRELCIGVYGSNLKCCYCYEAYRTPTNSTYVYQE